jgi:hypothetical protein
MEILLFTILIALIIGVIIVSVFLGITFKTVKKVYELFEFNFNEMCLSDFYKGNIHEKAKVCLDNTFYGNQVCLLNWVSNKNKNDFTCFYYVLQTSLKGKDGHVYTNNNFWITIYSKKYKETVGSARWSNTYMSRGSNKGKADIPFSHSIMTATSGNLIHLQGAEIITDYRNDVRKIHVFSKGSYVNKDYESYRKSLI